MEKRRKQVLAASFLAGAFAVTAGFAVQGHARAAQYRRMLDNTYQHAFTELATAAGELDVALRKVTYATSPELFSALCAQAYSKALAAFYAVERQRKNAMRSTGSANCMPRASAVSRTMVMPPGGSNFPQTKGTSMRNIPLPACFAVDRVWNRTMRGRWSYTQPPHSRTSPMPPTS